MPNSFDIPPDALCQVCGITEADSVGIRWYHRHQRRQALPACEPARNAGRVYDRAKQRARRARRRKEKTGSAFGSFGREVYIADVPNDTITLADYHRLRG